MSSAFHVLSLHQEDGKIFAHVFGMHFGDGDDDERHERLLRFDEDFSEGPDFCLVRLDIEGLERLVGIEDVVDLYPFLVQGESDELGRMMTRVHRQRDRTDDDQKAEDIVAEDDTRPCDG